MTYLIVSMKTSIYNLCESDQFIYVQKIWSLSRYESFKWRSNIWSRSTRINEIISREGGKAMKAGQLVKYYTAFILHLFEVLHLRILHSRLNIRGGGNSRRRKCRRRIVMLRGWSVIIKKRNQNFSAGLNRTLLESQTIARAIRKAKKK